MKTNKRNLGKLNLSKLMIAQVGNPNEVCGGSIPKETENCYSATVCTVFCGGDTIDTQ